MIICKELRDKAAWEKYINDHAQSSKESVPPVTFIQSYSWIDFQEVQGRETVPIGIYEDDILIGVGAGVIIPARRGTYLYFRHGPILNWSYKDVALKVIAYLQKLAAKKKIWFIRLSPLIDQKDPALKYFQDYPISIMNDVEGSDMWVMDIQEDEDKLLASMKKKVRYEVKKAYKNDITVGISRDTRELKAFYGILEDTVARNKWTPYSYDYIHRETEQFSKEDMVTVILIYKDTVPIAGGIFIHYARQTAYHYGASLTQYQSIPAMYALMWEAIKEGKRRGMEYFNFWGIAPEDNPNHPWEGLSRFKMKFPGQAYRWAPCRDIPISPKYQFTRLYERYDKWRKGY